MAAPFFQRIDISTAEPVEDRPPAERIVSGAPVNRTWVLEESADGKTYAGVWESEPGAWRVVYDEFEYCRILAGISLIHEEDSGTVHRLHAGDSFLLRPGFRGIWEVLETTRKEFVIRLP